MLRITHQAAREFYAEPGGKRWSLARDPRTGRPHVLYRPGENELEIEFNLGTFLVLFEGPEKDKLLQLIGSSVVGGRRLWAMSGTDL